MSENTDGSDAKSQAETSQVLLRRELWRFLIVGAAAAAVHFFTVILLVHSWQLQPLLANVLAFLVAFQVSYFGHRGWTFSHIQVRHAQSLPRFVLVALLSFATNESLYFVLLQYTVLPYWVALGFVLVLVASMTFVLSKLWAFTHSH